MAAERPCVILLTRDQREKTLRCLASLADVVSPPFDTIVWDNGSTDGTAEAVRARFPDVVVRRHPENLGVASGRNAAARVAAEVFGSELLLFLDNDMIVDPDFLQHLVAPFQRDPRLGQTTPKIRMLGREQWLYGAGGCAVNFRTGSTNHVGYGERDLGQFDVPATCIPSGGCMLVRSDLFERLGGFDPAYDPYGPEDLDFGLRARNVGFYGLYVPEAVVYHEPRPGRTFGGSGYTAEYARNKARLWLHFLHRHGSLRDRALFYAIGLPAGLLRRTARELRAGNLRGIAGLARGAFDALTRRSPPRTSR